MSPEPIRIAIVDDHPLFREGVAHTLRVERDIAVVAEGEAAEDAVRIAAGHRPDVIILDIDIPGGGLSAIRPIAEASPATRTLVLTVSTDDENVVRALRAGAQGYVVKGVTASELARIIRTVHAGRRYISPDLAAHVLTDLIASPAPAPEGDPLAVLTERELQVLELVSGGASNREIAERLHLAEGTIKYYVSSIMQKVNARNRVEAALLLQRLHRE